jgi:hypothetical protein
MRRPRLRFRVRTLLIVTAVIGLAMGLEGMRRRRAYCLNRAESHRGRFFMISGFHFQIPAGRRPALASRRQRQYQALREGRNPSTVPPWEPAEAVRMTERRDGSPMTRRELTEAERVAQEDKMARGYPHYAWHLGWARRFERAASRPWEAAPVDLPEPDQF